MLNKNYSRRTYGILIGLAIILGATLFKVTSTFILPVLISILLSLVFYPIVKKLSNRFKLPWAVSVIIITLTILFVFVLAFFFFWIGAKSLSDDYTKYDNKFLELYASLANTFGFKYDEGASFIKNIQDYLNLSEVLKTLALSATSIVINFSKTLVTILLFMCFLLIEMKHGNEKIEAIFKGKMKNQVHRIITKTITEVVHYISIKFFISLATGILVLIVLLAVGVDFAFMWALFAFVMNFIPTFGSIFSVALTSLFALLQFYSPQDPSILKIAIVLVGMTSINMVLGNILEPRIEGKSLDLSPFVILVSLTFWGWMWGFIGMILAVPIMVILKIICENFKFLHPIAIIIGNKTEDTVQQLYSIADDDSELEEEEENKTEAESDSE